jgi:MYXO-CTERM domain-containing protein
MIRFVAAALICSLLTTGTQPLLAQDASNPQTARSQDSSDWGLLGLIGLIGLLGLRKKGRED